MSKLLGCIADDFTGAGDLASELVRVGAKCVLFNGVPEPCETIDREVEVIVIALKTRSVEASIAVEYAMSALHWLEKNGCTDVFFKICSTFDSTPKGNIGPVLDALSKHRRAEVVIVNPAFFANERLVKNGVLFVKGVKLSDSPMKNHPLNPMWDSHIKKLLQPQTSNPVYDAMDMTLEELQDKRDTNKEGTLYYIPDAFEEEALNYVLNKIDDLHLCCGASDLGVAFYQHIFENHAEEKEEILDAEQTYSIDENVLIIVGSCSQQSQKQVNAYVKLGEPYFDCKFQLDSNFQALYEDICNAIKHMKHDILMIFSSTPCASISDGEEFSARIERLFAKVAVFAKQKGVKNYVIAGGETSGSVTQALGFKSFHVGQTIDPGVSILRPREDKDYKLVLKSGNFGGTYFFSDAVTKIKNNL